MMAILPLHVSLLLIYAVVLLIIVDTAAFTPPPPPPPTTTTTAFARRSQVAVARKWAPRARGHPQTCAPARTTTTTTTARRISCRSTGSALRAIAYMPDGSIIKEDDYGVVHVPEEEEEEQQRCSFLGYLNGPDLKGPLAVLAAARQNIDITTIRHIQAKAVTETCIDIEAICAADEVNCVNVLASVHFEQRCQNEDEVIHTLNVLHQQATLVLKQQEEERQKQKEHARLSGILEVDDDDESRVVGKRAAEQVDAAEPAALVEEALRPVTRVENATLAASVELAINDAPTAVDNVAITTETIIGEDASADETIAAKTSQAVTTTTTSELPEMPTTTAVDIVTTVAEQEATTTTTTPEASAAMNKTVTVTEVVKVIEEAPTPTTKDTATTDAETKTTSVQADDDIARTILAEEEEMDETTPTTSTDEAPPADKIPSWWIPAATEDHLADEYDALLDILNEDLFQKDLQQLVIRHARPESSVKVMTPKVHASILEMGPAGLLVEASMVNREHAVLPIKFPSVAKDLATLNDAILEVLVQGNDDKNGNKNAKPNN